MSDDLPSIVLYLPPGPSANRMWRKIPGRRKPALSAEYSEWLERAGWKVTMQMVSNQYQEIRGFFRTHVVFPISRRDLDNNPKPIFDLLERVHVISNDGNNESYSVDWHDNHDVKIMLWAVEGTGLRKLKPPSKRVLPRGSRKAPTKRSRIIRGAAVYARSLPK